jgi:formylglycine-generating enzyme required for sulfatase activity
MIKSYGEEVSRDPRRVRAILLDLCPKERAAINVLEAAILSGAVHALLRAEAPLSKQRLEALLATQAQRLSDEYYMKPLAASWAIESWMIALGLKSEKVKKAMPRSSIQKNIQIDSSQDWAIRTVGTIDLKMIRIQPGRFTMGSDNGYHNERQAHLVQLTQAFWIGETQVTQEQWKNLRRRNPSQKKSPDHPVDSVSWNDCIKFCQQLNKKEESVGGMPPNYHYRLPTEAEWEYACRSGTETDYAGILTDMAWFSGNSIGESQSVAQKNANAWGLYDMHGNVWEWCYDNYSDYRPETQVNPVVGNKGVPRIARGGSWFSNAKTCRASFRRGFGPDCINETMGFRVVLAPMLTKR